jgi:hypothetical protein
MNVIYTKFLLYLNLNSRVSKILFGTESLRLKDNVKKKDLLIQILVQKPLWTRKNSINLGISAL